MFSPSFVVADEEPKATAFVKGTLVGDRVHEDKGVRPAYLGFQIRLTSILSKHGDNESFDVCGIGRRQSNLEMMTSAV